jgi:hypothetical protein
MVEAISVNATNNATKKPMRHGVLEELCFSIFDRPFEMFTESASQLSMEAVATKVRGAPSSFVAVSHQPIVLTVSSVALQCPRT